MKIQKLNSNQIDAVNGGMLIGGSATATPQYLGIADYNKCLANKDNGSFTSLCMPNEKPSDCPSTSWDQLIELNSLPNC